MIRRRWLMPSLGIAAVLVLFGALLAREGYLGEVVDRVGEAGSPMPVQQLDSIDTLQQAFNHDAGTPRLIILVSPT